MTVGVVRDFDTRKPISGAKVRSWSLTSATTDAEGKFLVRGQPKGRENRLEVTVDGGPYIKVAKAVPNPRASARSLSTSPSSEEFGSKAK